MNLEQARFLSARLNDPEYRPAWYVWTGGWYELGGEQNYYFAHDYLTPDSIVLEIGTYRGKFARTILSKYDCWYVGYEPAMMAFEVARDDLKSFAKAAIIPMGVGSKTMSAELYDTERDSANLFSSGPSEAVPIMDIVEALDEIEDPVDLLVMNCEGAEFDIVERLLDSGYISKIDRLMAQWHDVKKYSFAHWILLESRLAETHNMKWNLGAWELWARKE